MSSKFNWEKDRVRHQMATQTHEDAVRRRYDGALTTRRSLDTLIARRNLSHRLACLCPDRRRAHPDTPCPHLPPRG